ncbi:hypothetical protein [Zhihengliuella halotolerans]|uniref:Uncharacterized protein n=1 Tax=Zhihengliuella halotolerans TaxID=370736 RepID=A0A4Q8AEZ0_9MICC|nr:hypothetical protein [Zhihengliuella halotolerans]RZU62852.1 hypothetical protein EV380_2457 [Zhihengliuella halotolerans]
MAATGLVTMTDIALLAHVQRPVVSMWRARSRDSSHPFPAVATRRAGRDLFDVDEICRWLAATGRGNNPAAAEDAAAFVSGAREDFPAVGALLALSALTGVPLSGRSANDLMDLADDADPDDAYLYREIEDLGAKAAALAGYTDRVSDAAYSPAAAFEQLVQDRFRTGLPELADTSLGGPLTQLTAEAAAAMSLATGADAFWEATPGGSDLVLGVSITLGESRPADLGLAMNFRGDCTEAAQRFAARRLRVHLAAHGHHGPAPAYDRSQGTPRIVVAQFPGPGEPAADAAGALRAIDEIALSMSDADGALIVGPARWLVDALSGPAESTRSQILRMGRLRAAVRLPAGLVPTRIRQPMALWVLGSAHPDVPLADRWTMTADLTAEELNTAGRQDLISDIAASLGDRSALRAHAFRFASLVQTSRLIASSGPLTGLRRPPASKGRPADPSAELIRAERLLEHVQAPANTNIPAERFGFGLTRGSGTPTPSATVRALLASGDLAYLPGARIDNADLTHDGGAGLRVLGTDSPAGTARIDPLVLASRYPRARLTEPGDVVFRTSGAPAAVVDPVGAGVVRYPDRILRIRGASLLPGPLAADLSGGRGPWRGWLVRRFDPEDTPDLGEALGDIDVERTRLRDQLERLDALTDRLSDGAAAGALRIITTQTTTEGDH